MCTSSVATIYEASASIKFTDILPVTPGHKSYGEGNLVLSFAQPLDEDIGTCKRRRSVAEVLKRHDWVGSDDGGPSLKRQATNCGVDLIPYPGMGGIRMICMNSWLGLVYFPYDMISNRIVPAVVSVEGDTRSARRPSICRSFCNCWKTVRCT